MYRGFCVLHYDWSVILANQRNVLLELETSGR